MVRHRILIPAFPGSNPGSAVRKVVSIYRENDLFLCPETGDFRIQMEKFRIMTETFRIQTEASRPGPAVIATAF